MLETSGGCVRPKPPVLPPPTRHVGRLTVPGLAASTAQMKLGCAFICQAVQVELSARGGLSASTCMHARMAASPAGKHSPSTSMLQQVAQFW